MVADNKTTSYICLEVANHRAKWKFYHVYATCVCEVLLTFHASKSLVGYLCAVFTFHHDSFQTAFG